MAVVATVAALTAAAVAHAQTPPAPVPAGTTTIEMQPRTLTRGGQPSPVDFTGGRIRRGRPLPARQIVVSYPIAITIGMQRVYASLRVSCPDGLRLDNLSAGGSIAPQVIGPDPFVRRRDFDYAGQRSWGVIADYNARAATAGQTIRGFVHVLCR